MLSFEWRRLNCRENFFLLNYSVKVTKTNQNPNCHSLFVNYAQANESYYDIGNKMQFLQDLMQPVCHVKCYSICKINLRLKWWMRRIKWSNAWKRRRNQKQKKIESMNAWPIWKNYWMKRNCSSHNWFILFHIILCFSAHWNEKLLVLQNWNYFDSIKQFEINIETLGYNHLNWIW